MRRSCTCSTKRAGAACWRATAHEASPAHDRRPPRTRNVGAGAADAPLSTYLRESNNMELVYPHLNGVHGTFAIGPSHVLFVGMGGKIVDEPESTRLEGERL